MVNFQIQSLLDKAQSDDPDLRFMALTDLSKETALASFQMDEVNEIRTMEMVLKLMEDTNGEVKNAAVKALSSLSPRLRKNQLSKVIDRLIILSSGGAGKDEQLRDVASLALKTVTSSFSLDSPVAGTIVEKLPPKLLIQLDTASLPPQQTLETLDILSDIFFRFQPLVLQQTGVQIEALRVLVGLLSTGRPAVKKKAIASLGALVTASSPEVFTSLSKTLIATLSASSTLHDVSRAYVSLVGAISKSSPQKTGAVLKDVMPAILKTCADDAEDEDREIGLQTLESLLLKCPTEVTPFINSITSIAVKSIAYDPNYAGDDDGDEDEEMEDAEDEDDEDFEDEYEDDEDDTWKVRRAAAKVLAAIIATRFELLLEFYRSVLPALISRISEREESVRLEIFATLSILLHQTLVFGRASRSNEDDGFSRLSPATLKRKREEEENEDARMEEPFDESPNALLRAQAPSLLKQVLKQLGTKSIQTKQAGFTLLRELSAVLDGGLESQAPVVCVRVSEALAATGSATTALLTAETLSFLGQFFSLHPLKVYQAHLPKFVPQIVRLSHDKAQRTSAEAFVVASELARSLRPSQLQPLGEDLVPHIDQLFEAAVSVLDGTLADVDVRVKSLDTLADLLTYEGDVLESQHAVCLNLLKTNVNNETLRLPALRASARVASSQLCQGEVFDAWLLDSLQNVASLLRRGSRSVKVASFECLEALLSRLGSSVTEPIASELIVELRPFIVDTDLHDLPLALNVVTLLLLLQPSVKGSIETQILPQVLALTRSPVLIGAPLEAVSSFFSGLVGADPDLALKLIPELTKLSSADKTIPDSTSGGLQAYRTVSQCVGVIVTASQRNSAGVIAELSRVITQSNSPEPSVLLSLLSLGEIGCAIDMSSHVDIFNRFIELFRAPNENIKSSAAFAAGNFAVGAHKYLQPIVKQVESATDRDTRLLALHALKEAIFHCPRPQLESIAETLWKPLFEEAEEKTDKTDETKAEETRNVLASCIGKLTTANPSKYLPQLQSRLQSPSPRIRATVASAVRYTFTDTASAYDDILATLIVEFLSLMHDQDLTVRRLSLGSLNAAAQNKPQLIREHLGTLLPLLYGETEVKKELMRTVQMGPWKQVFDDGLETRKTAYETMYTLLDTCLSKLDISTFLSRVVAGLSDVDEIRVICFLSLGRLAQVAPASVSHILDDVSDNFKETMKAFVGGKDTVKQEFDRKAEIQQSALRTISMLAKLSTPSTSPRFEELVVTTKKDFAREWSELQ